MANLITTLIIALSLLFGGGAATVAAAQTSQPENPLYNLKLYSENALIDLTSTPQSQFNLALDFVDRRFEEIKTMMSLGNSPKEQDILRYKAQIETAMRTAASLPNEDAIQALLQLQTRLETQTQTLLQLHLNHPENADMNMTMLQEMLQERIQLVANGEQNLTQLRDQIQLQTQLQLNETGQRNGEAPANGNGAQNNNGAEYGNPTPSGQINMYGNGNNATAVPNGYGNFATPPTNGYGNYTTPPAYGGMNYQNNGETTGPANSWGEGPSTSGNR